MTNEEWQTSKKAGSKQYKRAYVGNLVSIPDVSTQESLLRNLFSSSALQSYKIEIHPLKHPVGKCYALVECNDVSDAIKCLDGVLFHGERIVVKAEKRGKALNGRNAHSDGSSFGGSHWSKPKTMFRKEGNVNSQQPLQTLTTSTRIQNDVPSNNRLETKQQEEEDSFYNRQHQSLDALMSEYGEYDPNYEQMKHQTISSSSSSSRSIIDTSSFTYSSTSKPTTNETHESHSHDFYDKCNKPLSELLLMQDYGEYDPDYEKMKKQAIENSYPSSSSILESSYPSSSRMMPSHDTSSSHYSGGGGALSHHQKAPIHVQIVSFGYKYGIPEKQSFWSHSNPMSVVDCRNLPTCHFSLSKMSGLNYKVKRSLLSPYYGNTTSYATSKDNEDMKDDNTSNGMDEKESTCANHTHKQTNNSNNPLIVQGKDTAQRIISCIIDAIKDGGHGYAFPLNMTIYVGSDFGRHRSVVLTEHIAIQVRQLLRTNDGGKVTEPVSVDTRHRDVDLIHKEEESLRKDQEREHKANVRRKKKQEWLEGSSLNDEDLW